MPSPHRITSLALAIYVPLAAAALAWAWLAGRRSVLLLDHPWMTSAFPVRLAVSLGLGLALAAAIVATTPHLVKRAAWARALHEEIRELLGPLRPGEVTVLALASGLGEELFFRGAMQPALGLWLTSLIFGAVHVGPRRVFVAWAAWAFAVGLALGAIFELTGVLWGPILAHVSINQRNMTFIRRH